MTQPNLAVIDANGTKQTIFTANPNGQTTAEKSQPVVLAIDQILSLPSGAATDASLVTIGATQHADAQALLTAISTTNADLAALTAANHTDLSALLTKTAAGGATDANLTSVTGTLHADLQSLLSAVGVTNADLLALTSAQHNDLAGLIAKLVAGGATDTNLTAIGATSHTDLTAIATAISTTNADLVALTTANHTDLAAVLAKAPVLPTGSGETNRTVTTAAAVAIQLMASNLARKYFEIQNLETSTTLYFRKDGNPAGVNVAGSFALAPGAFYAGQSTGAVSIISSIAGHKFTAVEA